MATTFTDNLGAWTTIALPAAGATNFSNSATAGIQTAPVTFIDGNSNVPQAVDVMLQVSSSATGALANDYNVYLFAAESLDSNNYTGGAPAVGTVTGSYTFANTPVGSAPYATDLRLVGAITLVAQSEQHRKVFRMSPVRPYTVFVALNYSGNVLATTSLGYQVVKGDGR